MQIVDELESIQVEHQHHPIRASLIGRLQNCRHAPKQQGTIWQIGQSIVKGQALNQSLILLSLRRLSLDADVVCDRSVSTSNRRDNHLFDICFAVFARVVELSTPDIALPQGCPQILVCARRGQTAVQQ